MLRVEDLSVTFRTRRGPVEAATNISFELESGETLGLVGESGCGKSTVAMAIMGHLGRNGAVTHGRVVRPPRVAMVYQEPASALNPNLTVGEQLAEVPVYRQRMTWRQAREQAAVMLGEVRLPDPERVLASYPHQLSGGQQQRVVIAMALLADPELLVLDEPTTGLDVTIEAAIVELVVRLQQERGTALLYISHNLGLIAHVCDRVAVMYAGEIIEDGPATEIFAAPRHPYTAGLLRCLPEPGADKRRHKLLPLPGMIPLPGERTPNCRFAPRCAFVESGRCDAGPVPLQEGVRCVRWREISFEVISPSMVAEKRVRAEPLGRIEALTKFYPLERRRKLRALHGVSFDLGRNETVAIVGESGSGKSSLARVLVGLESASSGRAELFGIDVAARPLERRSVEELRRLQMVFQNPDETLNPSFSVGTQIRRAVKKLGGAVSAKQLLGMVRLPPTIAAAKPPQLSGGQKQRVAIARAFAGMPELVIADEPLSALDVSVSAAVVELLIEIQRRSGTALMLISHDLGLVRYIADHVVVLYLGEVMEAGTADEVFAPPHHPYTEALLSAVPRVRDEKRGRRVILEAEMPSPLMPPIGCPFHTRCHRKVGPICETQKPPEQRTPSGHRISCHIPLEVLRNDHAAIR